MNESSVYPLPDPTLFSQSHQPYSDAEQHAAVELDRAAFRIDVAVVEQALARAPERVLSCLPSSRLTALHGNFQSA